jgi:hypothetical protein
MNLSKYSIKISNQKKEKLKLWPYHPVTGHVAASGPMMAKSASPFASPIAVSWPLLTWQPGRLCQTDTSVVLPFRTLPRHQLAPRSGLTPIWAVRSVIE